MDEKFICRECGMDEPEAQAEFDDTLCLGCERTELFEFAEEDAKSFAESNCRITRRIPDFAGLDDDDEYGSVSYLWSGYDSWLAYCRHKCTNYDELILGLDRDDPIHGRLYLEIKGRIHELIEENEGLELIEDPHSN